ncbi:hypothetical protein M885DRAFT_616987 [Pelagophyceae sp. CCMP2097]|nr:hypothetical protein M885DRAFT_616987 [Pelagophyceae sp. CCMP2097]
MEELFSVKRVWFLGRQVPVLSQNEFGPCALLAIVNVLLLRNQLSINEDIRTVTVQDLVTMVADRLFEANGDDAARQDAVGEQTRQALDAAVSLLVVLKNGLDVNCRFDTPTFEFTDCQAVFDLLDIEMYHGWLYDPEEADTAAICKSRAYNELISDVVAAASETAMDGDNEAAARRVHDAGVIQSFFQKSSTQLTYYGLTQLHKTLRDRQLCVFYRNLHFNALFKIDDQLFVLVTDLGYLHEQDIVWERLDDIDGDTEFATALFEQTPIKTAQTPYQAGEDDADYLVALQMQNDSDAAVAAELGAVESVNGEAEDAPAFVEATDATVAKPDARRRQEADDHAAALRLARQLEDSDYHAALQLQYGDPAPPREPAPNPRRVAPAPAPAAQPRATRAAQPFGCDLS